MSQITSEQIRAAAEDACNKGFPYFKHGESSTPPHDITKDLEAALKVGEVLPDCFDSVSCDTSSNILGHFVFKGYFRPSETLEVEVTLNVDRYDAVFSSTHIVEFFKRYVLQEPREIPAIPATTPHDTYFALRYLHDNESLKSTTFRFGQNQEIDYDR